MYSRSVVHKNLEEFAAREKWMPVYHTIEQVQEFSAYVDSVTKRDQNSRSTYIEVTKKLTHRRQDEIKRWIENEQILCSLDSNYFERIYAYICDEKGEIFKFQNRKSQEVFDSVLADFDEMQVAIELLYLKGRQVGICLGPDTRVLMANLTWKRIDDVHVGDEVVAVDENPITQVGAKAKARRMRTAIVQDKMERLHPTIEITLDTGAKLIATPEHPFLCCQRSGFNLEWRRTGKIQVGDKIRRLVNVWGEPDKEDYWLGGFIDGEGSLQKGDHAGCRLTVTQVDGKVLDRARKIITERYGPIYESVDRREPGESSKLGSQEVHKIAVNRIEKLFELLGKCRPTRFIDRRWWENRELPGKHIGGQWATVQAIRYVGTQRVVNIQTSHQTFIAEGVVSHNTTKAALKFLHRLLFIPHTQAVMASVKADKSELIGRILKICHERLLWWLIPRSTTDRIKLWGWENGSILSVQSGTQATGIAQGWTPTLIHISEIGDIPNPKKTIEEGLLPATHSSRKLFLIFEGTGNGSTGWLADTWRTAKKDWPLGRSRLCPRFIPWPMATDLYPEADWIRKFPIPERWEPCRETKKHVQRCELFIRNTDYLAAVAGSEWEMPREQQWFWEFNFLAYAQKHASKVWMSQMPADDIEDLTGKNDTIFEPELIEVVTNQRKKEVQAYAIAGSSIDDGFEPRESEIDYNEPRIPVQWQSNRGQNYEWIMIPLKMFNEEDERNALDKILIFHDPEPGRDYSIGIDTADGLDKEDEERSALIITDSRGGDQCDEQVAELCSRRINPAQMVGFAACLAAYFGRRTKDPRGCKFCIEQRDRPGDDCQLQLKLMGFNFHHLMTRYDGKQVKESHGIKQGWYSSRWSVPFMMNRFVEAINGGWYKPHSRYLIAELKDLERKIVAGISKMEHRSGNYDDRVRAAAHSYITRHHVENLADRAQKRYAGPSEKLPDVDYSFPQGSVISVGQGW